MNFRNDRHATHARVGHNRASVAPAMREVSEADWKVFRELREVALERFCERALEELQPIVDDMSRSYHARYLDVCRRLRASDEQLANAFNNPRRSDMMRQLLMLVGLGLLEEGELGRFSDGTRSTIARVVE
jgi:hypothetical protein